jgi:hypothetical protein
MIITPSPRRRPAVEPFFMDYISTIGEDPLSANSHIYIGAVLHRIGPLYRNRHYRIDGLRPGFLSRYFTTLSEAVQELLDMYIPWSSTHLTASKDNEIIRVRNVEW